MVGTSFRMTRRTNGKELIVVHSLGVAGTEVQVLKLKITVANKNVVNS